MHFSTLTTLTLTLFPLFAPLPVQAAALARAIDKRDFVIAQPNPDTMVKIHAEPGVRIKGWPKHAEPNPQYDAEWQTDREFAMPDIRTGSPGASITHEGKKWAVMAEAKGGALTAYVSFSLRFVSSSAESRLQMCIKLICVTQTPDIARRPTQC